MIWKYQNPNPYEKSVQQFSYWYSIILQLIWPNLAANNFLKYLLLFKNFTTKFNKLATNRQFWHLEISPLFIYIFAAKKEKKNKEEVRAGKEEKQELHTLN